jgi:hypothetical protein
MTLLKARPVAGGFQEGTRLLAAEMNTIQDEYVKAIDGYGGGTYTNTSRITMNGEVNIAELAGTINLSGVLRTDGYEFTLTGGAGASLTIKGGGTVQVGETGSIGAIYIHDDGGLLIQTGGTFAALSGSTATFHESSTTTFETDSILNINADCVVTEAEGAVINEGGSYAQTGIRTLSGSGRISERIISGADANTTYGPLDADVVVVGYGSLGGNRIYTLETSSNGDSITFISRDINYYINFTSTATINIPYNLQTHSGNILRNATGYCSTITFIYSSGAGSAPAAGWYVKNYSLM